MTPITAALLAFTAAAPAAAQLSPEEERVAAAVTANQPAAVALLAETVNINSGTLNAEGQRRVYDALAPRFAALGFDVRYVQPDVPGRGGHLVATRTGDRGKRLLLIGHMDTVFEEDSPFQRWEMLDDSIARGPGASDMKGGCTASIMAFTFLSRLTHLFKGEIVLTLVSDEETGGKWGTVWLLDNVPLVTGDAMLNGEPTSTAQISFAEKG